LSRASLLFERWPRFASRHPWWVIVATALALAAAGVLFATTRGTFGDAFVIPGAESQEMMDLLEERFPSSAGDSAYVVVRSPDGLKDGAGRAEIEDMAAELVALPGVAAVLSPFDAPGQMSADGTIAFIDVRYFETAQHADESDVQELLDWRKTRDRPGFQVELGGSVVRPMERGAPGNAEVIGLTAASVILLIAFGSVVAMGVPIATALIALVAGFFLIGSMASLVAMPGFTPQFAAMIGIGVGIDYALLIVTRFREARAKGEDLDGSIVRAAGTAGRSVLFAGSTVVVALLGLWAVGLPAVGWVGVAASLVVALSVIVALAVLPALLRVTGPHIDRWRIPGLAAPVTDSETGFGYRFARLVQRHSLLFMVFSAGLLLAMAAPLVDIRLGSSDAGNDPPSFSSRRAYDLLAAGFGPGFNGPVIIGFRIDNGDPAALEGIPERLTAIDNVALVTPPRLNEDGTAAVITVIPESAPQDDATGELVRDLRAELHALLHGTGTDPLVGGPTALFIDVGERMNDRLPYFIGGVIALSFLLLTMLFRSVVVAAKAAVMNLLSIGASFGVLVAVFQWGWLGSVVGVHREGPIESFLPMMLFAVLFGLSMDYEVFLVSRVREEYLKRGDNADAVARGLAVTSRVISAAAAIMIAVFISFALSDQRVVKEFGIGLAVAIFVDATIVRLLLVPSLMQLMGRANWWMPAWLDRLVPRIGVEGPAKRVPVEGVVGGK
jgi:RND superfamily putative drug exporter